MPIDWTALTPNEFEELCYALVSANGFQELSWYGKGGGDKGRDIIARKETAYTDRMCVSERWVVQCKRYTAQPPGKAEISDFLTQCREHKPDHALIVISNTLTPNTKDWLDAVRPEYRFRIHLWEEMDLIREIKAHRKDLTARFPALLRQPAFLAPEPLRFCRTQVSPVYFRSDSDEFEEIGFFILNDYGYEMNVRWIHAFIEYIRDHEVEFIAPEDLNLQDR